MKYFVISLKRTPERLEEFRRQNLNFEAEIFDAIDGNSVDRDFLLSNGIITESIKNRYTNGAIGVALSHRDLWKQCMESNQPITVIEDDAFLAKNFETIVESNTYDDGWDFIFWGSNLDQCVGVHLIPGIVYSEFKTHQDQLISNIWQFRSLNIQSVLYRCSFAVGLVCYSISPKGASYLLNNVFPLRDYQRPYLNFGIDHSVLEELQNITAWYSIPPLALTKNDQNTSTVQK